MSTRKTLTALCLLVLLFMVSCSTKTATPSSVPPTESSQQSITPGGATEENPNENYTMLPMISGKMANVTLDALADGTTQQLKVGEVMAVILESNPSTGYSWFATISNPQVLVQMGEAEYQAPASGNPQVIGASGTQTFLFQAIASGTTTLTLDYKRSFEENVSPEKTVTIQVEVK